MEEVVKKTGKFIKKFIIFCLAVILSSLIIFSLQIFIYYFSKYDLLPEIISNFTLLKFRGSQLLNDPSTYTWELPFWLEIPLYLFLTLKFNNILKRKEIDKVLSSKISTFLKVVSVCIVYLYLFADSHTGRQFLLSVLPEKYENSFEINCIQKSVKFSGLEFLDKDPYLCKVCIFERNCEYKGINNPQSESRLESAFNKY